MNKQDIIEEIKRFMKLSEPLELNSMTAKSYAYGKLDAYEHVLLMLGSMEQ